MVSEQDIHAALRRHFGYDDFRDGQYQPIAEILAGRDAVVVMPTGSGKSLCYQLAALMLPGTTLVVSPLIALMTDQVAALERRHIPATCLNSSLSPAEMSARLDAMMLGEYKLVYIAPERFRSARFLEAVSRTELALLTIDEAHCISQWGHDFRPDYLNIRDALAGFPDIPILAVTATATPDVRADIIRQLRLGEAPREKPYVQVTPTRQGSAGAVRTFYANTVNADGSASFDFTMTGLQSGVWEFAVALFDNGVKVGGGAVSTYILGGDVTEGSGEVYPTEWIDMGFAITMPEQIEGTIGSRINVQPGEVTFTWKATNGVPASYRWYLDGVLLATETSGTYRHTFTKAGVYSMTCVAIDASGLEMGHSTVAVTILADSPSAASWTFNSPAAGANTKNLPGAITGTPLVHVHMEDPNGVMVYSGYPTLTGSGNTWSGSFKYTQSGTDRTGTISISGGKITLTLPAAYSGPVTLGVSV